MAASSVASFLVLGGGQDPHMYRQKKKIVTYMRERAPQKHIVRSQNTSAHFIQSMQFPFITYAMALYRQYNDKIGY